MLFVSRTVDTPAGPRNSTWTGLTVSRKPATVFVWVGAGPIRRKSPVLESAPGRLRIRDTLRGTLKCVGSV